VQRAVSFATKLGFDLERAGAVEIDLVVLGGSGAPRRVERIADVGRCPQHRSVGDDGDA
jgi:hypothetical protein